MDIDKCWIAYFIHYATGEGMHYVVAIANSAERAGQLYEERAPEYWRGHSTTAPLAGILEKYSGMSAVIPVEVHRRTTDPLCWTLEYFAMIDFNCS